MKWDAKVIGLVFRELVCLSLTEDVGVVLVFSRDL